jgi:hypothetical protein
MPCHAMHPIQDLFLESFSYELQFDMHFLCTPSCANLSILVKSGCYKFVLELNTKNLGNSTSFLTITHTTLSAKRFRKYEILTTDVVAVFCFWTKQRRNGFSIS